MLSIQNTVFQNLGLEHKIMSTDIACSIVRVTPQVFLLNNLTFINTTVTMNFEYNNLTNTANQATFNFTNITSSQITSKHILILPLLNTDLS